MQNMKNMQINNNIIKLTDKEKQFLIYLLNNQSANIPTSSDNLQIRLNPDPRLDEITSMKKAIEIETEDWIPFSRYLQIFETLSEHEKNTIKAKQTVKNGLTHTYSPVEYYKEMTQWL